MPAKNTSSFSLAQETDTLLDRTQFLARTKLPSKLNTKQVFEEIIRPQPGTDLSTASTLRFTIEPHRSAFTSFNTDFAAVVWAKVKITTQEYKSDNTLEPASTDSWDPATHKFFFPASGGILNVFSSCHVMYNDIYTDDSSHISAYDLNLLNIIQGIETSFNPDEADLHHNLTQGFSPNFTNYTEYERIKANMANFFPDSDSMDTVREFKLKIPAYPFRTLDPRTRHNLKVNFKPAVAGSACLIPPQTKINIVLNKSNIPLLYTMLSTLYFAVHGAANETKKDDQFKRWTEFTVGTTKKKITKIEVELEDIYFIVRRILYDTNVKIERNLFSTYKFTMYELTSASVQQINIQWSTLQSPQCLYLFFIRQAELNYLEAYKTNICPGSSYRPTNLESMALMAGLDRAMYKNFHLTGLSTNNMEPSQAMYQRQLVEQGFLSPKNERELFFAFQTRSPVVNTGNRGTLNIFPIDLTRTKWEKSYTTGALNQSPLTLELIFSGALESKWYLGVLFNYKSLVNFGGSVQNQTVGFNLD